VDLHSVPRFNPADDRNPQTARPAGPQPGTPVDRGDLVDALHDRAARRRLGAWLNVQIAHDTLLRRGNWPLAVAALIATAVTVLALWFTGAFVTGLFDAVHAGGRHTATWLTGDHVIRTATGAVTGWLDTRTGGLPATSTELSAAWLGIAGVLFVFAVAGSTYARIAWALTGAATTAAAYLGAAPASAAAAGATTAAVWLLLSLPVYRRRRSRRPAAAGPAR
jgi:hypothetical protein